MLLPSIKKRFSVRKFKNKPVEKEKIDLLIEAARLAPSAKNIQPWHFVVIQDKEKRAQLTSICKDQAFVSEAPVSIAVCCNDIEYIMSCGEKKYVVDGTIAAEHIVLQAAELGLGTCWICAFYHNQMAKLINLPDDYKIICLIATGYPAIERKPRHLKAVSDILSYDSF